MDHMIYITKSNLKFILNTFKVKNVNYNFLIKEIGNNLDNSCLFSDYEKKQILLKKNLICNHDKFCLVNQDIINNSDNYIFSMSKYKLYNSTPSYHKNSKCTFLNKDYENYIIDNNISDSLLDEYKDWLKNSNKLFQKNFSEFGLIHIKKWGNKIKFPEYEYHSNSGVEDIIHICLDDIIKDIKKIYINNIPLEDKKQFKNNVHCSFISKKNDIDIENIFIKKYKIEFQKIHDLKLKIIDYLVNSWISEINTNNNHNTYIFSLDILKKIGFKPCCCCYN
ncbi:hypothetical protein [Cetobacterium sp. SF1]|uniref:hypothetical protein n=1 Tax=Cetobacterium sp. SF1 TaxID=3417654 RepID=UPI003CF635E6